jgi:hypothetical protein
MNPKVEKILKQYQENVGLFNIMGRSDISKKLAEIMKTPGFASAVEYFVNIGIDGSTEIDSHIGAISSEYVADRILEGVEPSIALTRDALAYTFSKLDEFPDDGRDAMVELAEVALSLQAELGMA